jgi:hypothetical protein
MLSFSHFIPIFNKISLLWRDLTQRGERRMKRRPKDMVVLRKIVLYKYN